MSAADIGIGMGADASARLIEEWQLAKARCIYNAKLLCVTLHCSLVEQSSIVGFGSRRLDAKAASFVALVYLVRETHRQTEREWRCGFKHLLNAPLAQQVEQAG